MVILIESSPTGRERQGQMAQGKRSVSQTRWFRALGLAAIAFVLSPALAAQADLEAIQLRLSERIVLAAVDNTGNIVAAGSVITLQRGQLQMCATTAPAAAGAPGNSYKNGKLSAGMFSWNLGLGLMKIDPNTIPMHTTMAGEKFWIVEYNVRKNGVEFKLWTDPDSNNIRYWSWLVIPFEKKQIPSPDELINTLAEVIGVDNQGVEQTQGSASVSAAEPSQGGQRGAVDGRYFARGNSSSFFDIAADGTFSLLQGGETYRGTYIVDGEFLAISGPKIKGPLKLHIAGDSLVLLLNGSAYEKQAKAAPASAPATAPPPAPMPEIAPPPPPSDAPAPMPAIAPPPPPPAAAAVPPTISLGQTMNQVTASFGEPLKVANLGGKSIFYYKDMKVTFINGKVSNVE